MPLPFEGDPALLGRLLAGVSEVDQQPSATRLPPPAELPADLGAHPNGGRPSVLSVRPSIWSYVGGLLRGLPYRPNVTTQGALLGASAGACR